MSSCMPSVKKALSFSSLMFVNGKTATDLSAILGFSGAGVVGFTSTGTTDAPGASCLRVTKNTTPTATNTVASETTSTTGGPFFATVGVAPGAASARLATGERER